MLRRLSAACLLAAFALVGPFGCATTPTAAAPVEPPPPAQPAPAAEPPPPPPPEPVAAPAPKPKPKPKPASQAVPARATAPRAAPPSRPTPAPAPEAPETVPFNPAAMKRPTRVSGREPQLTPEAREARVQGTALVRCTVTPQGEVTRCRVLNRLQHMESELLDALSTWKVTPVLLDGQPVAVDYTFSFRF